MGPLLKDKTVSPIKASTIMTHSWSHGIPVDISYQVSKCQR